MTALKWEDIDLGSATLKVVAGKGGKTARVNLSSTLVEALDQTPMEKRSGYVLPARSRIAVYKRLEAACRVAKVRFKGVHALRHASGTRLHDETGDLALVADHLRHIAWTPLGATPRPTTHSSRKRSGTGNTHNSLHQRTRSFTTISSCNFSSLGS